MLAWASNSNGRYRMQRKSTLGVLYLVALAACAPNLPILPIEPTSEPMQPVEAIRAEVGDEYVYERQDGSRFLNVVTSVNGSVLTVQHGDCQTKYDINISKYDVNVFKYISWDNCVPNDSHGTISYESVSNTKLFPLVVGSKEKMLQTGNSSTPHQRSNLRFDCETLEAVRVDVPAGSFNTHHVRCDDPFWIREYFVSKDGVIVMSYLWRLNGSDYRLRKLVSFTPG